MKHVFVPLGFVLGGLITGPFVPFPVRLIAIAVTCWVIFRLLQVRRKLRKQDASMAIDEVFESDRT